METRWFATWRHDDVAPREALVQMRNTKEEAEELRKSWLKRHEENFCYSCWQKRNLQLGDNSFIVSRVRTEEAVYKTLGF